MTRYETSLDFRRNVTGEDLRLTGWYNYFPSVNATYCAPTDDACVRCRGLVQSGSWTGQSFTWRDASSNVSTEVMRHFCRGLDGCVCVMACESDNWAANMPAACDDGGSASNNGKQVAPTDVTSYSTMLVFFLVLQVMLLAVFMYRRGLCRRGTQAQPPPPRPEGPYNNVDAIASPSNRLRLSGWSKMQSALIERESKQRACYSQQPQGIASAEMENPAVQIEEGRNQTRLLSSQGSPQDSGTARAVYVGAQDDPRQQHSSRVSDAQQIVGIGGATAAGSVERIADTSVTRIERAS
ncbi:unnamed protein product [Hyaloperonospora brassicae]|uniref:Transmembrane protein n=1 Tax=Hyaloperonospora brassicae TaxID=162125 RepID=A0AAV0TK63_HYABA|nr:unnamed protein product [Hyaloperonospora brassicae]